MRFAGDTAGRRLYSMPPARCGRRTFGTMGIASLYAQDCSVQLDRNAGMLDGFVCPHTFDQQVQHHP